MLLLLLLLLLQLLLLLLLLLLLILPLLYIYIIIYIPSPPSPPPPRLLLLRPPAITLRKERNAATARRLPANWVVGGTMLAKKPQRVASSTQSTKVAGQSPEIALWIWPWTCWGMLLGIAAQKRSSSVGGTTRLIILDWSCESWLVV